MSFEILHSAVGLITSETVRKDDFATVRLVSGVSSHVHLEHIEGLEGFLVSGAVVPVAGEGFLVGITVVLDVVDQVLEGGKLLLAERTVDPLAELVGRLIAVLVVGVRIRVLAIVVLHIFVLVLHLLLLVLQLVLVVELAVAATEQQALVVVGGHGHLLRLEPVRWLGRWLGAELARGPTAGARVDIASAGLGPGGGVLGALAAHPLGSVGVLRGAVVGDGRLDEQHLILVQDGLVGGGGGGCCGGGGGRGPQRRTGRGPGLVRVAGKEVGRALGRARRLLRVRLAERRELA